MKVTVTLELRFDVMPDGSVWTLSNFHQGFWQRYLQVYDQVEIVARANPVQNVSTQAKRVDHGPAIIFSPLPFYIGPIGYLKKWLAIKKALKQVATNSEAVILRVGSPIADILQPMLAANNHPYALEVVGDPYDSFAPGSIKSFLRPFYRWWFCKKMRTQALHASGISYVTSVRLPERYPAKSVAKKIFASSIELLDSQIASNPRDYKGKKSFRLISVGALEDWRKGPDTALKALNILRSNGHDIFLDWIGDGRNRAKIEEMAENMELSKYVSFKGHLPSGDAIFKALDEADIFILPTRGEGLPRAMIEAMARGLVCTGSDVGGIPELLQPEFIHRPENVDSLVNIIEKLVASPDLMNSQSRMNWEKSRNYLSQELQIRRKDLYENLKRITDAWKKSRSLRKDF